MQFKYVFHDKGLDISDKKEIPDNEIYLDIGNSIRKGIIDHHHLQLNNNEETCTAKELFKHIELLDALKDKETIIFHTHVHPDTDALFSICLLQYYLEEKIIPANTANITKFVSDINSGNIEIKNDGNVTLYKLICCLGEDYKNEKKLDRYLELIEAAIAQNCKDPSFSFMDGDVLNLLSGFEKLSSFFKEKIKEINNDYERYKSDKNTMCFEDTIFLTTFDEKKEGYYYNDKSVKALIWTKKPASIFNRIWARNEAFILTIVPQRENLSYSYGGKIFDCTDIIISISPNKSLQYSLKPLAYLLEQYEQHREIEFLGEQNSKRDHSCPRGGKEGDGNRFFKKPWGTTSDPWYFSADGTLVQSPHSGSLLTIEEVIKIVKTFAKCYVKEHQLIENKNDKNNEGVPKTAMNVLIPFTFAPKFHKNVKKWLEKEGWKFADEENDRLYWMTKDNSYISTFIREYRESKSHFNIYKHPNTTNVIQLKNMTDICNEHDNKNDKNDKHCILKEYDPLKYLLFEKECYLILFEFGTGIVILKQPSILSDKLSASREIDRLNKRQEIINKHFIKHPIFVNEELELKGLAPHFYTSIEVSSECWNVSNSLIINYAKQICDVFDNNVKTYNIEKISERAILASSRMGVALVIATDKFDEKVNEFSKLESNVMEYSYLRKFSNAWFFMYLIALQQRYSLVEIKRRFTKLGENTNKAKKKIKQLRETLISFYATSYFTSATDDELGDNIYRTWHDVLMIKELKTDIMDQIEQHDEYQSKKLTSKLEIISIVAVFAVVFEAIVNAGVIWGEWRWGKIIVSVLITALIAIIIKILGFIKRN